MLRRLQLSYKITSRHIMDSRQPSTFSTNPNNSPIPQQPINGHQSGLGRQKRNQKKTILWLGLSFIGLIVLIFAIFIVWYKIQLSAVGSDVNQRVIVSIPSGTTPGQIGQLLQDKSVIRSNVAFDIYVRVNNVKSKLQAGVYSISPSESTQEIVKRLSSGDISDLQINITFYPGATLTDTVTKDISKRLDAKTVLLRAGYSESEITAAFNATYNGPLFEGKPSGTDVEGYIYGETYRFDKTATVKQILQRTFDEFYLVIQENNFVQEFKSHGLSLYQGITLASIVQKEILPPPSPDPSTDQKQAAQVFYSRLSNGTTLGSDVTYQYAADKLGVARDTNLNSPYNTRRFAGLPPGPISSPGLTALKAVATPANTKYLFFLSGDDHVTYFATTDAQHQANIANHCAVKCSSL